MAAKRAKATTRERLSVYVETSVVSYLTARPTRDLVRAAQQESACEWWAMREAYELYVSKIVLDEAGAGDPGAAARRLEALRDVPLLRNVPEAGSLAAELLRAAALPAKAKVDALHVALATVHGMDLLVTWNCAHIANATMRRKIESICGGAGFEVPVICTPIELLKE
jgi:predicted nucleic acid-binding protein